MAKKTPVPTKASKSGPAQLSDDAPAPSASPAWADPARSDTAATGGHPPPGVEPAVPPAPLKGRDPSPEEIARRAYELYLARGDREGADVDDWLDAERELRARS